MADFVESSQNVLETVVTQNSAGAAVAQNVLEAIVLGRVSGAQVAQLVLECIVTPASFYSPRRRLDETWFRP